MILRFGRFDLDLERQELRRAGMRMHLQPQPLKVLALLAQRQGELVTREELRLHLWGADTFVDFERGLNYCLSRVRGVLGDSASSPRFIETLPRRGYRFMAAVEAAGAGPALAPAATPVPRARPALRARAPWYALAAVCLLLPLVRNGAPLTRHTAQASALHEQARRQFPGGRPGLERSLALERQALERDPYLRTAWIGLAHTHLELGERGYVDPARAFPAARAAAQEALRLGERGDERRVLGVVALVYDWDWESARRELTRALALDPGSGAAHVAWARYLSVMGQHAQAAAAARRAAVLQPACESGIEEGWCYYRARDYEKATRALRRDMNNGATGTHERLFAVYRRQGNDRQAAFEAQQVIIHAGLAPSQAAALAARPAGEAVRLFLTGALRYLDGSPGAPPDRLATMRAALGDRQGAIRDLERALSARSPSLPLALWDPDFDELRSDPGFERVARAAGVKLRPEELTRAGGRLGSAPHRGLLSRSPIALGALLKPRSG